MMHHLLWVFLIVLIVKTKHKLIKIEIKKFCISQNKIYKKTS